jgi:hypothetical protein
MTEFMNGIALNKEYPDTFEIPTASEKAEIVPGDNIKVGTGGERFWVMVTEIVNRHTIVGTVDNDLICTDVHGFKLGDKISVQYDHVLDILKANENG